jgi:diguanylate cyclase (GGDEF)-like protein
VLSLPVIILVAVLDQAVPYVIGRFRVAAAAITMLILTALVFLKQWRLHDQLRLANKTLEEAALTDPLTGIRNRRYFSATVEADVAQTLRAFAGRAGSSRDLIFYLIDMDNFKEVNDLYGHDAGDRLLVESAQRIASAIRDSDEIVRWGGEEFLIVSRFTDRNHADALALRVMRAICGTPFQIDSSRIIGRTCSIGWAAFPWLEDDVAAFGYEAVLKLADQALRQAKVAGKNRAIGAAPPGDPALCCRP